MIKSILNVKHSMSIFNGGLIMFAIGLLMVVIEISLQWNKEELVIAMKKIVLLSCTKSKKDYPCYLD